MKHKLGILAAVLFAGVVAAGPIKTWATGEYITASDLNAALAHLHANLGHGHGPVITNADIASGAAISLSKVSGITAALLPKAWADIQTVCSSDPCTIDEGYGVTSIERVATGEYYVNFEARTDAKFAVLVSANETYVCHSGARITTRVYVSCVISNTLAPVDTAFSFLLLDTDN